MEALAGGAEIDQQFRNGVQRAAHHPRDAPEAVALHHRLDDLDPLCRAQLVHDGMIMRERSRNVNIKPTTSHTITRMDTDDLSTRPDQEGHGVRPAAEISEMIVKLVISLCVRRRASTAPQRESTCNSCGVGVASTNRKGRHQVPGQDPLMSPLEREWAMK